MSEHHERHRRATRYLNSPRPMTPDERESINLFFLSHFPKRPPLWQRALLWLLAGLAIGAVIALSGCAHKATHYTAPDAAPLQAAQHEVVQAVAVVRQHSAKAAQALSRAKTAHGQARTYHGAEGVLIGEAEAILPRPEFRNAPPALLPDIAALTAKLAELTAARAATDGALAAVTPSLAEATSENAATDAAAARAIAKADEITTKLGPAYEAKVETLVDEANKGQIAWAKDSAKIVKLETASWVNRILALAGACALAGLAFLWWTGRAAKLAATVASKL